MNIGTLLKAAEYIERRDREAEHGYASTRPMPAFCQSRRKLEVTKRVKTRGNIRCSHNELEKNRRAHLRSCSERLKAAVPLGQDISKHTMLGLLKAAKHFIKQLENIDNQQRLVKEQLLRDQRNLQQTLNQLSSGRYRLHSVSESSTVSSALSSCRSTSPTDSEEVDILGISGGFASDQDDEHSVDSVSRDSGIDVKHAVIHSQ